MREQLFNFDASLAAVAGTGGELTRHSDWMSAFLSLTRLVEGALTREPLRKPVLFFDELPWLASRRSRFLQAFSWFWNSWAQSRRVVVVICGSAASWMIRQVVNDRGGLHNRITLRIHLAPFTLAETEQYLRSRAIQLSRFQVLQIYMALGGVPFYLKQVQPGESAIQNIQRICFDRTGLLRDEFGKLYPALFEKSERHVEVIRALAERRKGLSRQEIIESTKLSNAGSLTRILVELEQSDFIAKYPAYGGKQQGVLYRLTDEYSAFYLQVMRSNANLGEGGFLALSQKPAFVSWAGFAFESVCLRHVQQLKGALGITGIYAQAATFHSRGDAGAGIGGVQIDLLLDRADQTISTIEAKFSPEPFVLTKAYAEQLQTKLSRFRLLTRTRKQLFLVLVSPYGVQSNQHSIGLVDAVVTQDALFAA